MKKVIAFVLVFLLLVPASVVSANNSKLYPDASIDVFLHGERLEFEIDPIQTQGTTFVQFTTIFKALGLSYEWLADTREVHGFNSKTDIWLTLNDRYAVLNGELIELPVAPFAYNGRTLVPLRFVSQATGLQVDWDNINREIRIYSKESSSASPKQKSVDVTLLMLGFEKGDSQNEILTYMKPYSSAERNEYYVKYDYIPLMDYDTQLYFDFIDNAFAGVSYYYGRYNEPQNIVDDYYDIVSALEETYGAVHSYGIYETWHEGVPTVEVDADINGQLLLYGIEEGEYEIYAGWEFSNVYIQANILQTLDGPNVEVIVAYK